MTEEEFENHRQQHAQFLKQHWKNWRNPSLSPVMDHPLEVLKEIFETALLKTSVCPEGTYFQEVYSLADLLFRAGVPATESTVCAWFDAQASHKYPFSNCRNEGLVLWAEQQDANGSLSVRLLTCLRKHYPALSRKGSDKQHRALMRRLGVALKLIKDDVIPEAKDAWTAKSLAWSDSLPEQQREKWQALLELANSQQSGRPSKAYLKQAEAIAKELPQFAMIMTDILQSIGSDGPVGVKWRGVQTPWKNLLDEDFTDLLRALIWLCVPYQELAKPLREAAGRCAVKIKGHGPLCAKIATVCAEVLSRQDVTTSVQALSSLQNMVKHKSLRKGLAKAISRVEEKSGSEWAALEESSVPDFGFSMPNNPALRIGECTVTLSVSKGGEPELAWNERGQVPRSQPPASILSDHADEVKTLKGVLREVKKTWRHQVLRLERMMCQGRVISTAVWQKHYLDHPIVGLLSRRLLWKVGSELVAFPPPHDLGASSPVTLEGALVSIPQDGMVCLWHPAALSTHDRVAWEKWVLGKRLIQPFQQALREVHEVEETGEGGFDFRFRGELLHQGAFAALSKERGWNYSFHGEPEQFEPFRLFPDANIRGVMKVEEELDKNGQSLIWLRIESVKFMSGNGLLPLKSLPSIIFSEVMRDIGLFSVASRSTKATGWRNTIPLSERND